MASSPLFFYDLGSPYAYLALERAERVLGVFPQLRPIVLGPVFAHRGSGSWAHTGTRAANVAEIERRARAYGLPPLRWPPGWPPNTLQAMRVAVWAQRLGRGDELTLAAFRCAFAEGGDLGSVEVLRGVAERAGLPAGELEAAIAEPALKQELKDRTAQAIALGVRGAPTVAVGERLFWGDDRLEAAAEALAPAR